MSALRRIGVSKHSRGSRTLSARGTRRAASPLVVWQSSVGHVPTHRVTLSSSGSRTPDSCQELAPYAGRPKWLTVPLLGPLKCRLAPRRFSGSLLVSTIRRLPVLLGFRCVGPAEESYELDPSASGCVLSSGRRWLPVRELSPPPAG